MGDPIEIVTWPKHQNLFYLVNGGGIVFEVKGSGYAGIGLARKPAFNCDYWVGIEGPDLCWIKRDDNNASKSAQGRYLISPDQYTTFWLQWSGGAIRLGRKGGHRPLVSLANPRSTGLKYITFSVLREHEPVYWRFDLAPVRHNLDIDSKLVQGGKMRWVVANTQLPPGALIGGYENEVLYIIRGRHENALTPGKFVPSEGTAYVSWGGQSHPKEDFEVLCGFDCKWVSTTDDKVPASAIVGGHSENGQERLYIGRAEHNGHTIPGKVQPSHKACYICVDDQEIAKKKYEILVEPTLIRSANKTMLTDNHEASGSDDEDPDSYARYEYDLDDESNDEMDQVMAL